MRACISGGSSGTSKPWHKSLVIHSFCTISGAPVCNLSLPSTCAKTYLTSHFAPQSHASREEAQKDAAMEPLLSSFLYASILAHNSFEQSLAFVLANRLSNATMLPTQLFEIFHQVRAIRSALGWHTRSFQALGAGGLAQHWDAHWNRQGQAAGSSSSTACRCQVICAAVGWADSVSDWTLPHALRC